MIADHDRLVTGPEWENESSSSNEEVFPPFRSTSEEKINFVSAEMLIRHAKCSVYEGEMRNQKHKEHPESFRNVSGV